MFKGFPANSSHKLVSHKDYFVVENFVNLNQNFIFMRIYLMLLLLLTLSVARKVEQAVSQILAIGLTPTGSKPVLDFFHDIFCTCQIFNILRTLSKSMLQFQNRYRTGFK